MENLLDFILDIRQNGVSELGSAEDLEIENVCCALFATGDLTEPHYTLVEKPNIPKGSGVTVISLVLYPESSGDGTFEVQYVPDNTDDPIVEEYGELEIAAVPTVQFIERLLNKAK